MQRSGLLILALALCVTRAFAGDFIMPGERTSVYSRGRGRLARLSIGGNVPIGTNNVAGQTFIVSDGGTASIFANATTLHISANATTQNLQTVYNDTITTAPAFIVRRARGTLASPAAIQSGDLMGLWGARGYTGSAFTGANPALFQFLAAEAWSPSALGTNASMNITRNGTTSAVVGWELFNTGELSIGTANTAAGAWLSLPAGSTSAASAPLKFRLTSAALMTSPEAGAMEAVTDDLYYTISTGTARKGVVLNDGTSLTSGRVPIATTNGRLSDDSDLTFATDTLTATHIAQSTYKNDGIHHSTGATYISGTGTAGVDNTAQTVKSVTFPANTLTQVGDRVRVRAYWKGDTGSPITATTKFGPTGTEVTIGAITDSGAASFFVTETWLHYIDNTHANILASNGTGGLDGTISNANVAGFTWASDQTILVAQNQIGNNHIVVYALIVDVMPKGL